MNFALTRAGWAASGSTYAIGQAYTSGDRHLLRAIEIAQRLDGVTDRGAWLTDVASLNGSFAVVGRYSCELRAAVDRVRSFPLFYALDRETTRISDHALELVPSNRMPVLNDECLLEFRHTGYVTGEETLVQGLRQIRAGHALLHDTGTADPEQVCYYEFRHRNVANGDDEELTSQLLGVHERVFRRLLDDVGDRQLVIPLSGGYDSRLIGYSLRELGARNVLCYTYGVPGNWESKISCELARHLGFQWTIVPYSATNWRAIGKTPAFERYFSEAGNFASLAHVQDWPAVQALVAEQKIARDAVFVPGHTGDFLTGGHIPKWFAKRRYVDADELLQSIFDAHYSLWDWPRHAAGEMRRIFSKRVERVVGSVTTGTVDQAADVFESWECQERQAKFIINSVRVYEFFGFQWRLPLFDAELMDFWSRISLGERLHRRLYFQFVHRYQRLPVTEANTDRGAVLGAAVHLIDAGGLRPIAKRLRDRFRKTVWRRQYTSDLAWFGLVDPDEFRRRYTGRENAHAFFVLRYLSSLNRS